LSQIPIQAANKEIECANRLPVNSLRQTSWSQDRIAADPDCFAYVTKDQAETSALFELIATRHIAEVR
jgi:hypothetical protein